MKRYVIAWLLLPVLALAAPPAPPTGEDRLLTMQSTEQRVIGCKEPPEALSAAVKVCDGGTRHLKTCTVDGDCTGGGTCRAALVRVISQATDATPYGILPSDCFLADDNTRLRCLVVPYGRNGRKYQVRMYAQTVGNQLLACDVRVDVSDVGPFKPQ